VIPDHVELEVDIRTLPGQTGDEARAMLLDALGDLAEYVDIESNDDGSTASPIDTPMWDALSRGTARRVKASRHELPIDEARFWPKNQIVWAGPRERPEPLDSLVSALQLELHRDKFILERRPFAAHVTLLRRAAKPAALPPLPKVRWPVSEFLLVRSRTSAKGPTYEPVERFALR
jgi:2'-5' RNA ligase